MSGDCTSPGCGTDEEIARYTVGEVRTHDAAVTLHEYDPAWPARFEREAERIRGALGDAARTIEHVGSTSVPGLAAKPIIDIVVAVADSADEAAYGPALEAAGYRLTIREPDWHEHRMFEDPDTHVHVFTVGDAEVRAWSRSATASAATTRIGSVCRRQADAAARRWRHVQHYADAKSGVIEEILARA